MPENQEELLRRTNQLLGELDSDRQKAKAKEASEAWTKTAAVSLVFVAVITALAVQKSTSFGSRVAPRPMWCGKITAPSTLLWPCTASMP